MSTFHRRMMLIRANYREEFDRSTCKHPFVHGHWGLLNKTYKMDSPVIVGLLLAFLRFPHTRGTSENYLTLVRTKGWWPPEQESVPLLGASFGPKITISEETMRSGTSGKKDSSAVKGHFRLKTARRTKTVQNSKKQKRNGTAHAEENFVIRIHSHAMQSCERTWAPDWRWPMLRGRSPTNHVPCRTYWP